MKQENQPGAHTRDNKEPPGEPTLLDTKEKPQVPRSQIALWPRTAFNWLLANSFAPGWLPKSLRLPIIGYLVAILVQAAAVFITQLLVQAYPSFALTGVLGVLAIALVALNWGAGPGLLATLAGAALFAVQPPAFTWKLNDEKSIVEVLLFLLVGFVMSVAGSQFGRTRHNAAELAASLMTERARLEAEARANELEAIFETMTDSVFVFDNSGHMLRVNAAARELFALDGQPEHYSRLMQERKYNFAPYDDNGQLLAEEEWPLYRVLHGEVLTSANSIDVTVRAPNGQELQLNISGAPMHNQEGKLIGAVCICRDVTERRQLEKRTQETLNALLAMAETLVLPLDPAETQSSRASGVAGSPSQLLVSDTPSGPLTLTTAEESAPTDVSKVAQRLVELTRSVLVCKRVAITTIEPESGEMRSIAATGLSAEEEQQWKARTPGFHLSELLAGTTEDSQLHANEAVILDMTRPSFSDKPNPYNISAMLIAPMSVGDQLIGILSLDYGGKEHEYSSEEIALAKAVAKLAALVIERERLLRERAEARANELALREANRRMDEFLGMTSHELKTPLTSIMGNTQLTARQLRNSMQNIQKMQGMLESTERQVKLLDRLVNDLLDLSRTQANQLELSLAPCDLATVVREAIEELRQVWPARTIHLELSADPTIVYGDSGRLSQVVTNYLTNALKYSPDDRPVQVRLQVESGQARVSVQDEGPGLPPAEQAHIWDRFYRADGVEVLSTSQSSMMGMGLGLYICKAIMEQHHGSVGVDSTPNVGSTFWFTLPLIEQQ